MIRRLVVPPELGEAAEVRVLLWYKKEGEPIGVDEALLELETDKAIVLVTARQAGTVRRCFSAAGDWLKVGDVAAWMSDDPTEPLPADRNAPAESILATFETT